MPCYTCPDHARFVEPVPGTGKSRSVCAAHKGPLARPADAVDLAVAELLGELVPATERNPR
jgi:hypothetical protein